MCLSTMPPRECVTAQTSESFPATALISAATLAARSCGWICRSVRSSHEADNLQCELRDANLPTKGWQVAEWLHMFSSRPRCEESHVHAAVRASHWQESRT